MCASNSVLDQDAHLMPQPIHEVQRRPLKVLCVGGDLAPYGAPRMQISLLLNINRNKFLPTVYFLRDEGGLRDLLPSDIRIQFGVKSPRRARNHALGIVAELFRLAREADIVFSMIEGPPLYLSAIAARLAHRPLISWVHNNWSAVLARSRKWHRPASKIFLPFANRTVCVSDGVLRDLIRYSPRLTDRAEAIPNPVPIDQVQMSALDEAPSWATRIFEKPTVLAVGRLVWQKGFDHLIEATALALKNGADFNLLILGDGEDRKDLMDIASELGIRERVFFPGFVSNPYPLFRQSRILALSSRFEGLPTVLIEALAVGLPVVSMDCQFGPHEILEGGRWGRLIPPQDVSALSRALGRAISEPEWIEGFRATGPSRALVYSAKTTVSRFESVLELAAKSFNK